MAKLKEQEQQAKQDQMKQLEQGLANTTITPPAASLSIEETMAKLNALQQRFVAGKQKLLPEGAEPTASMPTTTTTSSAPTMTTTTTVTNVEEIQLDEDMGTIPRKEPQMSESSESEGNKILFPFDSPN